MRRSWWRRKSEFEQEMSEELRDHIERQTAANIAAGMTPEDGRRQALLQLGAVEGLKENCREERRGFWLEALGADARYAGRVLSKNRGFTAIAVLTLALGIGANTAIFSVVSGVLLRPLSYARPDLLVRITDSYPQGALVAMRSNLRSVEVAGYSDGQELNLTGLGDPVRLYGTAVSANLFSLLGVKPQLGRVFLSGEDRPGKDNVVILSHALWEQRFGGDANVVGRLAMLEGVSRQIVGVMPEGFQIESSKAQFWVPLDLDSRLLGAYWGGGFMPVVGRLRPGVTLEQARAELQPYLPRIRAMFPWSMPDSLWASATVIPLQESFVSGVAEKLTILLGATGLVLLIACVNVANLYLARATKRQKELAVRAALGAGRWRICRQLLCESALLSVTGGGIGFLLAIAGLNWLKRILPADTPRLEAVSVDWRVMAFTALAALVTGILFGIAPSLEASRIAVAHSLRTSWQPATTRASHRLRSVLIVTEVALAVVLVIGAGLLVRSLWELAHVYPGFRSESVVTARINPSEELCTVFERCSSFYDSLLERTRALPGVSEAALTNVLPLEGRFSAFAASFEDHPQDPRDPAPVVLETVVSPSYFRLMGIPVLRGRGFTQADSAPEAAPVALITAATVRKYWPNQDPVGKHVKRVWATDWMTVIGVVGDVNQYSLAAALPDYVDGAVYEPFGNGVNDVKGLSKPQPTEMTLILRSATDPGNEASQLRGIVASANPDVPVSEIRTLATVVSDSAAGSRSTASLFSIFAALALLLGAIGVYGVVSYSVAQRTAEIGLRMAMGAEPKDVFALVIGQGVRLAVLGVVIGAGIALALTRTMTSLLFGVGPSDPFTFLSVAVLLVGVSVVACCIPARRAMRVDPMVALRYE